MELVTGKAGASHISAADLAAMYRGLLIADDCVLDEGDKLSCTMTDANTAEIGTGSCMLQAHHARIDVAEQVTIESGSVGYNRNDLIVARYTLGAGNVQGVYLAVIKGTATLGDATDPDYTEGDIDGGDVLAEFPLWRIPLTGITVGTPERIMPTIDTLQDQITSVRESVNIFTTREKTVDLTNVTTANVTADAVSGYTFVCWLQTATQGWSGSTYCSFPNAKTTAVWRSGSGSGVVRLQALYAKNV